MILNVSGRTDIVAFYMKWFMKRYNEGYIDVRNPFNRHLVSRINVCDVDAIVFCTKNPLPSLRYLREINKPIIYQVTLTAYKNDIEVNVVDKHLIIDAIKKISKIIGIDNVYVRYDPILLNDKYTVDYHIKAFTRMCELLDGYVKHIIVSFIDDYKNVRKNMNVLKLKEFTNDDIKNIGKYFYESASKHGMTIQTCFEEIDLVEFGFIKSDCVPVELAKRLTGKEKFKKWGVRKGNNCNCVEMVDIGTYNTCRHFCKYCYANYDEKLVEKNSKLHDVNSSLLIGHLEEDDVIKVRKDK